MQELLTVPEAQEYLRLSRTGAWNEVSSGRLPSVRIGKKRLVRNVDLVAYIEARLTGNSADESAAKGETPLAAQGGRRGRANHRP